MSQRQGAKLCEFYVHLSVHGACGHSLNALFAHYVTVRDYANAEHMVQGYWKRRRLADQRQKPRAEISLSGCHAAASEVCP